MRITSFTSHLKNGGLRPALFEIILTNPITTKADGTLPFRCMAATLPESTLNEISVRYFGRPVKFPGSRNFQSWNIQVIEDEDFLVRDSLEAWSTHINTLEGNRNALATSEPTQYKSTALVTMYSQTNIPIRTIKLIGCWPSNIDALQVSWDNGDDIAKYGVTLAYDYWVPESGQTDNQIL